MFRTGCFEVPPGKPGVLEVPFPATKSPTETKPRRAQLQQSSQHFRNGDLLLLMLLLLLLLLLLMLLLLPLLQIYPKPLEIRCGTSKNCA